MYLIKISVIMFFFFGNVSAGCAQQLLTETIDVKVNKPVDWTTYYFGENIHISYKIQSCDPEMGYDHESVLLKIDNQSNEIVTLDWHYLLGYNGNCKTCDYADEYSTRIKLPPLESIEGTCSIYGPRELKFFSKFIDANYTKGESLTSFKLDQLTITATTETND